MVPHHRVVARLSGLVGVVLLAVAPLVARVPKPLDAPDVTILAASSLQTALDDLAEPIRRATSGGVRMSYAASSALARQLESGAPADIFISADLDWMDS